jgi:DnaJ-class molecular chaperone
MYLNPQQVLEANKKRETIQKYFLKGVRLCNDCSGTGLKGVSEFDGNHCWDGTSFCDKCNGIGYLNWKETILEKLCPNCDGGGCKSCDGDGIVDWIRYLRLGRKK